jgi:predicted kinase
MCCLCHICKALLYVQRRIEHKHSAPAAVTLHSQRAHARCRYDSMEQALRGVIFGNATSDACRVEDCETGMGVYVSMRMRLACEIVRAGESGVDERYEVRERLRACLRRIARALTCVRR